MDWIVSKINEKFQDKYNFFKTYSVVYNQQRKTCCVTFLYPENKFLSDDDKNVLAQYVAEALSLKGETTVKFKKSYLDEELIIKAFLKFFNICMFFEKNTCKSNITSYNKFIHDTKHRFYVVLSYVLSKKLQIHLIWGVSCSIT